MFRKLSSLLMLALLGWNINAWAQINGDADLTDISGQTIKGSTLYANRTWTLAGENFISGNINLNGKTLTIKIAEGYSGTCSLTATSGSDMFKIGNGTLIIQGNVTNKIILDGANKKCRCIYENGNGTTDLSYVEIRNFSGFNGYGSMLYVEDGTNTVTMDHVYIHHCGDYNASTGGVGDGVIFTNTTTAKGCTMTMTNCEVADCNSTKQYGGVLKSGGANRVLVLTMENCKCHGNKSSGWGGFMLWSASTSPSKATLTNCEFYDNYALGLGGAISNEGTVELIGCTFHDNTAKVGGGAVASMPFTQAGANSGGLILSGGNVFYNNQTEETAESFKPACHNTNMPTGGGAIWVLHDKSVTANLNLGNETIRNNTSASHGGGIFIKRTDGTFTVNIGNETASPNIEGNAAGRKTDGTSIDGRNGGGIYVNGNVTVNMSNGVISSNSAANGGGVYIPSGATINITGNSTIKGNNATTTGGGVYAGGTVKVGAGSLTVMENHCASHSVKNNIYLPTDKKLTVISDDFNPQYVGIYAQNTADRFAVINCQSPATTSTLQNIYNGLLDGTCNVFDDKQLYSADYNSSDANNIYFWNTPWTPLQRQTTAADNLKLLPGSTDTYEVNDVKSLTAFLWHVNGISTHSSDEAFSTKHPEAKAKMTADIPMVGRYWVPIGTSDSPFTGTFDGEGHIISDLTMVAANASTEYGMFGNVAAGAAIKNVVLRDCLFTGTNDYAGSMVYKMNGGTLSDCQAHGVVNTASPGCTIGGLVGYASGGEIQSCYSCVEQSGYNMGGLVGETASGGMLKNSFANIKFQYLGSDNSKYIGGLVSINAGTTANCYVRELEGSTIGSAKYGTLVGNNTGSVDHCFAMSSPFKVEGNEPTTSGTYTAVIEGNSYQYRVHDCTASTTGKPLQRELNTWVDAQTGTTRYAKWGRPTTKIINGDYPLLLLDNANAVTGTTGQPLFAYGDINTLMETNTESNQAIFMYGNKDGMNSNNGSSASLFIGEDIALTQSSKAGDITATVGITLDNSAGEGGANPTQGGTDEIDWHFFSTALSNAPLGITYTDNEEVTFEGTPQPYQHTGNGYFPANVNDYYSEWDFYAYYEPEFQWINFKRNSASHWNEIAPWTNIPYTNESTLVPGKGYMVALADPEGTYLQCTGTLNNGNVAVSLSYAGEYRKGLNLLGNPYQSYLDFEEFANDNPSIWPSGENATTPYYIIMDEDEKGYLAYTLEQSPNHMAAGRYIHPHQGFMVVAGKPVDANFTDDMRVTDVGSYDAHFRDQQVAYPLVNLVATDANGNRDIATAELGRPDKGGAILADFATLANCLVYVHYDDKDYRIAFTQPGINSLPVRFEAFESGTYTLTWDMENGEFSYMHLIDNITGADVDMLTASEYTFTASPDDLRSRFKLVFDYTGIEEDGNAVANANFAYMSNGQLVVEGEGRLQVIDMNGRVLHQTQLYGDVNTVDLPQMATGLYVVKLGERTQKIVLE